MYVNSDCNRGLESHGHWKSFPNLRSDRNTKTGGQSCAKGGDCGLSARSSEVSQIGKTQGAENHKNVWYRIQSSISAVNVLWQYFCSECVVTILLAGVANQIQNGVDSHVSLINQSVQANRLDSCQDESNERLKTNVSHKVRTKYIRIWMSSPYSV